MLSHLLTAQLFAFLLLFCRIGSAIMLLPGFSESYVPPRIRLLLAVFFCILLVPVIPNLPPAPSTVPRLFVLILGEILTGLFIGGLSRVLITTIEIAGSVIAYETGLSSALTLGLSQQGQETALTNLLSYTAVVLIFATDLHHLMLRGLADSYGLFIPGEFPIPEDFAHHAVTMIASAFSMAMQLSAPSVVVGLLLNLGGGMISRLMPNFQVFFIMIAPQLFVSFSILMVTISSIMLWYMDYIKGALSGFLAP